MGNDERLIYLLAAIKDTKSSPPLTLVPDPVSHTAVSDTAYIHTTYHVSRTIYMLPRPRPEAKAA